MLKRNRTLLRGLVGLRTIVRAGGVAVALSVGLAGQAAVAAPNSSIVVDVKSGKVLFSSNPDAQRFPASLTKMMTLYMLFEAIDSGKTRLDSRITMSANAAAEPPSKLGLKAGQTLSVREAILALVTRSANDVATAIGEHIAGNEKTFAQRMTARAHQLGMSRTTFRNANGLPNTAQVTTARDMATLGRALQDHFPQYFKYFSTPSFVFQGRRIANHNRLLGRVDGVNGIKTGYTRASGFNLVTSVDRGGRKVVAVVLGGDTAKSRDAKMAGLIDTYLPQAARGARTAAVAQGAPSNVISPDDVTTTVASAAFAIPRLRPGLQEVLPPLAQPAPQQIASAEPMPIAPKPAAPGISEQDQIAALTTASITAGANSVFALDEAGPQEGDTALEDESDDTTAPPSVQSGWKIQIAASPSQQSAEDLLDRALAKGGKVLAQASPYTEPVQSGNSTLYRARFAGFADKNAARDACAYLSKQKFSCLAIAN